MSTYSEAPTTAQIERMTDEERADVIGWLQHERRAASQRRADAVKRRDRLQLEVTTADREADGARARETEISALLRKAQIISEVTTKAAQPTVAAS